MKYLEKYIIILFTLAIITPLYSQDISNAGTDFWFAFTEVYDRATAVYEANITSNNSASGTVSIPGSAFSATFTIVPGQVKRILLPASIVNNETNGVITSQSVHIVSSKPISVFATTTHKYRTEGSLVLPTPALGSEYLISSKPSEKTTKYGDFVIVAATNPCTIEIACPVTIPGVCSANIPWTVTLNSGECYQIKADKTGLDMTGTSVRAFNGTDVFAVYNGANFLTLSMPYNNTSDPIFEVEYPLSTWGKEYIVVPIAKILFTQYQIMAQDSLTNIYVDGVYVTTLNRGQIYEDTLFSEAVAITASKPIKVMHYLPTSKVSVGLEGDPAVAGIGANEQMFLDTITFAQHPGFELTSNHFNLVTRTSDTSLMRLDGASFIGWSVVSGLPSYAYAILVSDTGAHTLTTTGCGFLAYAYGTAYAESYYYTAGVSFNTHNDSITVNNNSSNDSIYCTNDILEFEISTNSNIPLSYKWYFGDGDSSILGMPTHRYFIPGSYRVMAILQYTCRNDTITDSLFIIACSIKAFNDTVICEGSTIELFATSSAGGYNWFDSLGNGSILSTDSVITVSPNITTTYGVYDISDTSYVKIRVDPLPNAGQNNSISICLEPASLNLFDTLGANISTNGIWQPNLSSSNQGLWNSELDDFGTYIYQVNGTRCPNDSATITISKECQPLIYIPNAFTPNADGINDFVFVRGQDIKSMYLVIYNRWGQSVFNTKNILDGWDGKNKKGELLNEGVYIYKVLGKFVDGSDIEISGNITLVR